MTVRMEKGKWYYQFMIKGQRYHGVCHGATDKKSAEKIETAIKFKSMQQQNGLIPKEEKNVSLNRLKDLYVSYAKVDSEGKAIRPSYLTGVLRKLFPTLKLQEPEHMEAHTDFYTKEAAEDYLVFGPHEEAWYALARHCFW